MAPLLKPLQNDSSLIWGTWSPSCGNYALQMTVNDHGSQYKEATRSTVLWNVYVNDCLQSVATVYEAITLSSELKQLLSKEGFNLTKWLCNRNEVLATIPECDKSKWLKELPFDGSLFERALGVYWDIDHDMLSYNITTKDKPLTKRSLLNILSSVCDPFRSCKPLCLEGQEGSTRFVQEEDDLG